MGEAVRTLAEVDAKRPRQVVEGAGKQLDGAGV